MASSAPILVVDDNPDLLEIFHLILEGKGYSIVTAPSAEQALTAIKRDRPSLILIDIVMPDVSGIEFIRSVRSIPELATIPIVAMSAKGSAYLSEAKEAGANMVIRKPLDFETLEAIFRGILRSNGPGLST